MNNLIKWIAGIAAAVLTALVVAWLTSPSPPPPKKCDVVIKEINRPQMFVNKKEKFTFNVINQAEVTATDCQIHWESKKWDSKQTSGSFGLGPGESRDVSIWSKEFKEDGLFETIAHVKCKDCEGNNLQIKISVMKMIPFEGTTF